MAEARVTQTTAEVLAKSKTAYVTQVVVEVLSQAGGGDDDDTQPVVIIVAN